MVEPDAGDHWIIGSTEQIHWEGENTSGAVRIELYMGSNFCHTITQSTPDDGFYTTTVDDYGCGENDNCRIKISDVDDSDCYDFSGYFTIEYDDVEVSSATNPSLFTLTSVVPNPFNPNTTIEFYLPNTSKVMFTMYDINGSVVKSYQSVYSPGVNYYIWNAESLPSGIFFIAASSQGLLQVEKCMLV